MTRKKYKLLVHAPGSTAACGYGVMGVIKIVSKLFCVRTTLQTHAFFCRAQLYTTA